MDNELRNALRLAVRRCRVALEQDYSEQLERHYGVHDDGRVAAEERLPQLDAQGLADRRDIVATVEHLRAGGATSAGAVAHYIREAAFSTLNRLTAIKLMEAPERGLVPESMGRGHASRGFRQFLMISPEAVRGEPDGGYRLYLELLCEDLSGEIGVLFDLSLAPGLLFPSESTLAEVLDELNAPALADVWREDETLGWVYQYFTPKELRDDARKASAAPRNAYELAFRNQFYTPRYVVEFLADNTLGRLWYEMRQGDTALAASCRYLVHRAHPIFLGPGEDSPPPYQPSDDWRDDPQDAMWLRPNPAHQDIEPLFRYALTVGGYDYAEHQLGIACGDLTNQRLRAYAESGRWSGTFEELRCCLFFEQRSWRHAGCVPEGNDLDEILDLHHAICERWDQEVEVVLHRPKRDPRKLRILDPACGSGHFLVYCFDLLETIYCEAWSDPELGPGLWGDFADEADFRRAVPGLILRHNLHGVDIDLRAVQIAQLVLWLRAQRSYAALKLRPAERPPVERVNVVAAEPLPGERELLTEFVQSLSPPPLADLVLDVWDGMANVGEIGSLLKADELIQRLVVEAKRDWQSDTLMQQMLLFDNTVVGRLMPMNMEFIRDDEFWDGAQRAVFQALRRYAETATNDDRYRRRLFANDAAQGFALLELFVEPFDVVLMNPPFGASGLGAKPYIDREYPRTKNDLYAAFVERGLAVLRPGGMLGAITSRTGFFLTSFRRWREEILLREARLTTFADLGYGVLDTAMVETAAYCLEKVE